MRVLIDSCLPVEIKEHFQFPLAKTAREMGWQNKKNGELLAAAAAQRFDVLITMDKNIPNQQFLSRFASAVLIVRARSNRLADLLPLVPSIIRMVSLVQKGHAAVVSS